MRRCQRVVDTVRHRSFSPAEWFGFVALGAGCLLVLAGFAKTAIVVLAGFVFVCLIMPFCSGTSFFFPVISRGRAGVQGVALSFDDGPDPVATPALLDQLRAFAVPATFFVTGEHARRYPALVKRILADGHAIGNHSESHDPLIMFRGVATLVHEMEQTQAILMRFGIRPLVFRPPVGILSPRYGPALQRTNLKAVTFNRRARDLGNRRVSGLADRIVTGIKAGDIVLLHDAAPRGNTDVPSLLDEIAKVLHGLKYRGLPVIPLETVIGTPVMERVQPEPVSTEGRNEA